MVRQRAECGKTEQQILEVRRQQGTPTDCLNKNSIQNQRSAIYSTVKENGNNYFLRFQIALTSETPM
jgi:hypothetical protein